MLTYALYLYLSGFALFLLGFSIFMYFENRKFGDNQFTMKLLPPPSRMAVPALAVSAMELQAPGFISGPVYTRDALQEEKADSAFSEAA